MNFASNLLICPPAATLTQLLCWYMTASSVFVRPKCCLTLPPGLSFFSAISVTAPSELVVANHNDQLLLAGSALLTLQKLCLVSVLAPNPVQH